jgi:hypothetical protein
MLALYRRLLRLYPDSYFREYGEEMASVFGQAQEETRHRGLSARILFCLREVFGVLAGAVREQFRYVHRNSLRRPDMRSFRFPRTTIFLMLVILAMIIVAIDKAHLQYSEPITLIIWDHFLGLLLNVFAFSAVGAISYAILFALRQTGVQRLSNVQTWVEKK